MKLKLLTLALLLTTFAQASHILGGEISWTCLPGGQYKFTLVLYRDCTGIPLPSLTESINTNAGAIITCTRTQVIYLNKECNPPTCLGANAGYMGAVEKNIYESGPITLNGTPPPAGWYFTWNSCCRPPNTSNIQNASSQGFTLLAMMYPFIPVGASTPQTASICYDSSPAFEEEPNLVFCAGSNSNYFGITSDLDGDSTFYRLTTPLSTGIVPPFTNVGWVSGYSTNSPLPNTSMNSNNVPANLDSLSGNMTFKSYTTGVFATSIKASSFRNGQLMAEVYRDAPVFIKNCAPPSGLCTPTVQNYPTVSFGYWPNTQDSLMNMSNSSLTGYEAYKRVAKAQIGDTVKFTLHSQDADLMPNCTPESIIIRAWGNGLSKGPLYDSINDCPAGLPCATLESLNSGGGFTSVLNNSIAFTWPITCDVRNGKHEFFFEISNNNCPLPTVKLVKVVINVNNPAHLQSPVFDTLISGINTSGDVELFWNKPDTATHFSHYVLLHQYGSNAPFILDSLMNYSDTSYVHVSPPSGTLRYWIRAVGGCFNSLDSVLLTSDSTSSITLKNSIGIEEQLAHIKYYPQPMQNKVVFDGLDGAANLDVQIFNVSGRLLRAESIENSIDKFEVEVADLENGVYVFVLSWADYSTAIKLIKHE